MFLYDPLCFLFSLTLQHCSYRRKHIFGMFKHKGVDLKLAREERIILSCARKFSPSWRHDFCPPLGILFQFLSLYHQDGQIFRGRTPPPLRSSAWGTSPFPPQFYAYGCRASLKVPRGFPDFFQNFHIFDT